MKARFDGDGGSRRLVEALKEQRIVEHSQPLAEALAAKGELVNFAATATIIEQGKDDNCVYLVLSGTYDVFVNQRPIATRTQGECIGEMAVLDPGAPRSATIKAKSPVVALRLSDQAFVDVVDAHPRAWRTLARVVSERLRHRSAFHRPPNERPLIFLGCSVETLPIAQSLQLLMKHDEVDFVVWTNGVFGPSSVSVDALMAQVDQSDFAGFIFGPDDRVASRGKEQDAPRDNTIFELGLFMGRLERQRTYIIKEQNDDIKIPSDLLGLTPITYRQPAELRKLDAALGPVATELRREIARLGTR